MPAHLPTLSTLRPSDLGPGLARRRVDQEVTRADVVGSRDHLVRGWEVGGGIGQHRREIPSVADAIDKFLVDAESRELKATSVRKYRHFLKKQLLPFAVSTRRTRLQQFDVEALRAFRASWKFKASTQQKKLETLRGFFRFCASAGWIESKQDYKPVRAA